jgi:recombination protein RecR
MVVETIKDLFVIENLGQFKGVYHVLNGAIDFTNGIGVEDIRIAELIERVKTSNIKEVILACNATLQGETTSRYIKTLLEGYDVLVTRLAHGLPIGGDLSYADEMTVLKALEGRIKY